MRSQCFIGGRSHRGPHIIGISDLPVGHNADRGVSQIWSGTGLPQDDRTGGGGSPLSRRSTLTAIFQRRAILSLSGAEVGGCCGTYPFAKATVHQHSGENQRFCHGGARTIQPKEGERQCPGGVSCANALVQQVTGQHTVQCGDVQSSFFQSFGERRLLKFGFGLFPGFLSHSCIGKNQVKRICQRSGSFFFADCVRIADHSGTGRKVIGLRADLFLHCTCLQSNFCP